MKNIKIIIIIFCIIVFIFFLNAPVNFPVNEIVNLKKGSSLSGLSLELKNKNIIRSRIFFEAFVILYGGEKHLVSGDYIFNKKLLVSEVAKRIVKGNYNITPISITIPEGFSRKEIGELFELKLKNFNKDNFLNLTLNKEGYLFPDTYFFFPSDNENIVFKTLQNNFNKKMENIYPLILSINKTEKDIIIMASLIEKEAKGDFDRAFISGILWKRLKIGMPLQVDAFKETYTIKGLPKNPIANPGLEAIKDAIYPKNSPYLYYLHDKNGNIYYAKNFEEHKLNILKYLK